MSDLSDDYHTLDNIEKNLSIMYLDENYVDFQASTIRGHFNRETQNVNKGKLKKEDRLWVNVSKGIWKNSEKANEIAREFLNENGMNIVKKTLIEEFNDIVNKEIILDIDDIGKVKEAVIKIRVNQGKFREKLLKKNPKCKICGLDNEKLLIASHIKAWAESNEREKLDDNNGFLLCPNHDALFDKHLISFEDNGEILISK